MDFQDAFFDELEKIAASISVLRKALSRLGVKVPKKETLPDVFKAITIPTKAQQRAASRIGKEPEWQAMVPQEIKSDLLGYMKREPGTIYVSKDVGKAIKPSATKQEARDLRTLTGVHEGLERGVKPKEMEYTSLHGSPKVMLQEMNMLNRLTGGKKAGDYLRKLRERGGEYPLLREQVTQAFGKRALPFLQPGSRVPKAMRKHFMKAQRKELGLEQAQKMMAGQADVIMGDAVKAQLSSAKRVKL